MQFLTWQDLLVFLVTLLVGLLGSGATQFLKEKYNLESRAAVLLTAGVAGVFAVLQMVLMNQLDWTQLTVQNFPVVFASVFSVATLYYKLLVKEPDAPEFFDESDAMG